MLCSGVCMLCSVCVHVCSVCVIHASMYASVVLIHVCLDYSQSNHPWVEVTLSSGQKVITRLLVSTIYYVSNHKVRIHILTIRLKMIAVMLNNMPYCVFLQ